MAVNYQKLWDILKERGMTRNELREAARVTTNAMVKLGKNESVQAEVLAKICRVLDCTMNDIMDIEDHIEIIEDLPEVDFLFELSSSYEYSTLDINTLDDFSTPHSKESLKSTLIEYCASAKLSYDACFELIEVLASKGTNISFPQNIEPDLSLIPFSDVLSDTCSSSEIAVISQQIDNYIKWAMKRNGYSLQDLVEKNKPHADADYSYLVEDGYIISSGSQKYTKYVGATVKAKSAIEVYPFNLIDAIFGDIGSRYCLNHRLSMLSEQVDSMLSTLTPSEESWIRLNFQYGISSESCLELLNIPYNEAFVEVMQDNPILRKALRKLRHPSRSRNLKKYWEIDPYKPYYLDWYSSWKENIKNKVIISFEGGNTLADALSEFYNDNVVDQVIKESGRWKERPNISIDEMEVSWRTYTALEISHIHNLEDLWRKHGENLSLNEFEKSGLRNVAGLGDEQVCELLDKMSKYELLPIGISKVTDIIDYAERIAIGNSDVPSIACVGINPEVLDLLLQLKYRNIDEVISDYSSGCLEASKTNLDAQLWEELCATVDMFVNRKFSVLHVTNKAYWRDILAKNASCALEEIRQAYILDKPLKCNPRELQEHIEDLFSINDLAFTIMHGTRTRAIRWSVMSISQFEKIDRQYQLLESNGLENCIIKRAFDTFFDELSDCRWLAIEVQNSVEDQCCLFDFSKERSYEIINLDKQVKTSLFKAIEFNAEMTTLSPQIIVESPVPVFEETLQLSIEELDLSVRAYNCLKRAETYTVKEIAQLKKQEFRGIRNLGKKSAEEIFQKLNSLGITMDYSLQELYEEQ